MNETTKNEKLFKIENEIKNVLDGLTFNLNTRTQLTLVHDDRLPDFVKGKIDLFTIVVGIVAEFGIKICENGQIEIKTHHEGLEN